MKPWKKTMLTTLLIASTAAAPVWADTREFQPPMAMPVMERVIPISAPAPDVLPLPGQIIPILAPAPDTLPQPPDAVQVVLAHRAVPASVTMSGKTVAFDQAPLIVDGSLMVPLRAIAEAAGGQVDWDAAGQSVAVTLPGFVARMQIGSASARVSTGDNLTLTVNMAQAPQLVGGRTLISADTLSSVIGMTEAGNQGSIMNLLPGKGPIGPVGEQPEGQLPVKDIIIGEIEELQSGDHVRFLLKGSPMSSGEPLLVWFSISDETKLVVADNQGHETAITASELKAGQTGEVELAGPMLLSYPAQAGAAVVKVLPVAPDASPEWDTLTGTIGEVEPGAGDRIRILLKGAPMSNGEPSLIWVTVNKETKVISRVNGQAVATADLQTGQSVEIELAGPILESYPAQGAAAVVKVVPAN